MDSRKKDDDAEHLLAIDDNLTNGCSCDDRKVLADERGTSSTGQWAAFPCGDAVDEVNSWHEEGRTMHEREPAQSVIAFGYVQHL